MSPFATRPAALDDCETLDLITVSASFATFLGHIPEALLDLTWTPAASADGWRRTLVDLPRSDLFDVHEHADRQVVGFVWAGTSDRLPEAGEIRALYVLPTQQGRGLGKHLFVHAARQLRNRSHDVLVVGCIRENPSCGFYRHLGGKESSREPNEVDGFETEEIFFVWNDIESLT